MKQVYHINIRLGDINSDLYFEEQATAESTVSLLVNMLTEEAKEKIKIEASVYDVYSKETSAEQILMGLGLTVKDIKN